MVFLSLLPSHFIKVWIYQPHSIHVWYIYLHLPLFIYHKNQPFMSMYIYISKYTSLIDPMGTSTPTNPPCQTQHFKALRQWSQRSHWSTNQFLTQMLHGSGKIYLVNHRNSYHFCFKTTGNTWFLGVSSWWKLRAIFPGTYISWKIGHVQGGNGLVNISIPSGQITIVHQPRFFQQKKCTGPKWQKKTRLGAKCAAKIPKPELRIMCFGHFRVILPLPWNREVGTSHSNTGRPQKIFQWKVMTSRSTQFWVYSYISHLLNVWYI